MEERRNEIEEKEYVIPSNAQNGEEMR